MESSPQEDEGNFIGLWGLGHAERGWGMEGRGGGSTRYIFLICWYFDKMCW